MNLAISDGEKVDMAKMEETVDGYVESFKFNKVVSTMMEFYNSNKNKVIDFESADKIRTILQVFAPGFK